MRDFGHGRSHRRGCAVSGKLGRNPFANKPTQAPITPTPEITKEKPKALPIVEENAALDFIVKIAHFACVDVPAGIQVWKITLRLLTL